MLDHVLVTPELAGQVVKVQVLHFNADYPASLEADPHSPLRSSDHDPVLVRLQVPAYRQYLPYGLRAR